METEFEGILRHDISSQDMDDDESSLNQLITISELNEAIHKQKTDAKSTDSYGIHPIMLKHFGSKTREFITMLFNRILEHGVWQWTASLTSMIRKEGRDNYLKPGSYRPICISSYIGKLLERIIERRLVLFGVNSGIIDQEQEGFLPKKNTSRYLYRMISSLHEARRRKLTSIILLIDFEKAYDSIPVKCLLVKLHRFGVRGRVLRLLASFLSTRTTNIKINDSIGPLRILMMIGLPQGAVLAPILFILYISDLLNHRNLPSPTREWVQTFKFADDGSVMVVGKNEEDCVSSMQSICDYITEWCSFWRLAVNCAHNKTEAMIIRPLQRRRSAAPVISAHRSLLSISGKEINYVRKSKVLGILIDDELKFDYHAKFKLQQSWYAWQHLKKNTTRVRGLNSSSLSILFKTVVLTKILYASPIWLERNIKVFKDLFARAKLKIIGSEYFPPNDVMEVILALPPLDLLSEVTTLKFVLKCMTSKDLMTGLMHQIAETPGHQCYGHIQLVKKYLASKTNTSDSTGIGTIRNFELGRVEDSDLIYDKNSIAKFMSQQWNRRLRADGSLLFKNDNVRVETFEIIRSPFIRRFENRRNNVQYIDFIHGRSARFMDFRKKVGLTTTDICEDCEDSRDSVDHKLFHCSQFQGHIRDNFIDSIGDADYKEAILFSGNIDTRNKFRELVDNICSTSSYDYRQVLNRV